MDSNTMHPLSLLPRAEPFFYPGGRIGCLLIHGFTGAPQEVRELGERLAAAGYTVCGPRLAHHGTYPADMTRSNWHDWYFSALDGWHLLNQNCDEIVVMGLSMGGATALLLAAWQRVAAVVSLAAPIRLREDRRLGYMRQIAAVYPYDPPLEGNWRERFDPEGRIAYPVTPLYAVPELVSYLQVVEKALPLVKVPALLMHAADDETVAPINLAEIYRLLGSAGKEKVLLERGSHVITEGVEKETVFGRVLAFVQEKVG